MKLKKGLSLALSLIFAAQLCLPVGALAADTPNADPTTCPECNSQPEVPTEPTLPEVPVNPEMPLMPLMPTVPALGAPKVDTATDTVTIDISDRYKNIVITETGYKIGKTETEETPHTGAYILTGTTKASGVYDHILVQNYGKTPINITLRNVDIQLSRESCCPFSIENGAVNLTLEGSNYLTGGDYAAGLKVTSGSRERHSSLTITEESTGSLTAMGGWEGAGIGSVAWIDSGDITINGGTINATGGQQSAGIGGSAWDHGGTITINGGTVNATGGADGPGIGGGTTGDGNTTIIINGGVVSARGGWRSAGIGCGTADRCDTTITINDGTVTATGGAGINNNGGGAGIGGGDNAGNDGPRKSNITIAINGGTVNATGGDNDEDKGGAGIGGGSRAAVGSTGDITINITGGTVTARGGKCGAGIGGGAAAKNTGTTAIAITGGEIITVGGAGIGGGGGAGIGGGAAAESTVTTTIAINGGDVTAFDSGPRSAGIGVGVNSKNTSSFVATGDALIFTPSISDETHKNDWKGIFFVGSTDGEILGYNLFTLSKNITIPSIYDLYMKKGQTLTVPKNLTLTVAGYIYTYGGTVGGDGNIVYPENILFTKPIDISTGNVNIYGTTCGNDCLGHAITGTTTQYSINVYGGKHKIQLPSADIKNDNKASAFAIKNYAEVDLILIGTSTLLGASGFAGLEVLKGNTLTITKGSTGTLNVTGGASGAGIGGGYYDSKSRQPGTITINGGTVNAKGGRDGAGIGGGWGCWGGDITINGGTVNAKGGYCGAGIGSGDGDGVSVGDTDGGNIEINGGTVKAISGDCGAGIGGGGYSAGGNIEINGGDITADGNTNGGAGIGGGNYGEGGNIEINGGTVKATGSYTFGSSAGAGAGIGAGAYRNSCNIKINGGNVTAIGASDSGFIAAAGIGSGSSGNDSLGKVTIRGGNVTATVANYNGSSEGAGAGIGNGYMSAGIGVIITGGNVTAIGGNQSAGIGSSSGGAETSMKDTVFISGGIVNATGGKMGAGIGGSFMGLGTPVTIYGGTINATGGDSSAGIGGGYKGVGGEITIDANAVVFATKGATAPNHIGNGRDGKDAVVNLNRGIVFKGDSGNFYGANVTLKEDVILPAGKNLTISSDKSLTIKKGITLTNNATLFLDGGKIDGDNIDGEGKLDGSGTFEVNLVSGDIGDIPTQIYTGNPVTPPITVNPTRTILGKDFTVTTRGFHFGYDNNTNIGTAKVVYTKGDQKAEKTFQIEKSATIFDGGIKLYNGTTETNAFTYGDTITVKATPKATGTATAALMVEPIQNQMALYLGSTQISNPVNPDNDGVYTMTYDTTKKGLAPAHNTLTAKYVGNNMMSDVSCDISVTLLPKPLTSATVHSKGCVYGGSTDIADVPLILTGMLDGDTVTATANGTMDGADVGAHAFTATATTLSGTHGGYYSLALSAVSGSVTIAPKPVTVAITAANKVYDGTNNATAAYAVDGAVGMDYITASGTATFDNKNVGDGKTVTAENITLRIYEGKASNYELPSNVTATTTANITKKPLTWNTNTKGTVVSKPYNDTTVATVEKLPTLVGMVGNEIVVAKPGTVTFAKTNAGTHAVTATGFGIAGADAGNYSAPVGQPTFAKGTITAKQITPEVTVASGPYTYNGRWQTPEITVKDSGTDITADHYTASYSDNWDAGTATVNVALKGNYRGNGSANFQIEKADTGSGTIKPDTIWMHVGMKINYSIPLPSISYARDTTYKFKSFTDTDNIFSGTPTVSYNSLKFTGSKNAKTGQAAEVVVTISSGNYNDFDVTLRVEVSAKSPVKITGLKADDGIYTGKPHNGYTGKITAKDKWGQSVVGWLVYTYTGIGNTTYKASSTSPTNAGSYMLTIEVDPACTTDTGSHDVITFTIDKASVMVEQGSYSVTKEWNGNTTQGAGSGALKVIGGAEGETVAVNATPRDYTSSDVGGHHRVIVDLTLADTDGNYVLTNSTVEVPGIITPSSVYSGTEASAPSGIPETKSDIAITLQPVVVDGEAVEYAKGNSSTTHGAWQNSTDFGALTPNTTYYFFARVADNGTHAAGKASAGTAITTEKKKSPLIAPKGMTFPVGRVWNSYFTVAELLGEWEYITGTPLPKDAKFSGVTGPAVDVRNVLQSISIDSTEGSKTFGNLIFTSKDNKTVNGEDTFYITVTFQQYEDVTFPLTFRNSEKRPALISATLESKVYDGSVMELPTPTSSASPALTYTYQWRKDNGTALSTAPKDAGNYALVITGANDNSIGSLTINFMIFKRSLTVTAESKSILSGANAPAYDYKVAGLVESEKLTDVIATCGYKSNGSVSSAKGNYPITVSGGTVSGGNDNHSITYVPGTLTVTLNTTVLDTAIAAAKAAKSGVTVSDKDPSQVTNGTRFVTTAAMAALDAALVGAETSKSGATTNGQITAAADALTSATEAFIAAIQTGSYSYGSVDVDWSNYPKPNKPSADRFIDIKGHWAEASIRFVVEESLFNGISHTLFAPDIPMTRGMLVTVLYRQAGSPTVEAGGSEWYSSARTWAMQTAISDGTNMDDAITRQELVTMLHRYAKHIGIDVSVGEDTNILSYNDAFDLPLWSIPAFQWSCGADIIKGTNENLLPASQATRAEVATMLQRFVALKTK